MLKSTFDVIIIGGGPSGLAAALALARTQRSIAIFDSERYRNAPVKEMRNVPGFEGRSPSDWRKQVRDAINEKYNEYVKIYNKKLVRIIEEEPGRLFDAEDVDGQHYHGRKVIFASGVSDILPEIEGFEQLWGNEVLHCVYCHGFEHRGDHIGLLLSKESLSNQAGFHMSVNKFYQLAGHVTVLLNGINLEDSEALAAIGVTAEMIAAFKARKFTLEHRKVVKLEKSLDHHGKVKVHFDQGDSADFGAILHSPLTKPSVDVLPLFKSLNLEDKIQPRGILQSTPPFGTVRPGIFVAGDASTMMAQVVQAQATGQVAAVGADEELAKEDLKSIM